MNVRSSATKKVAARKTDQGRSKTTGLALVAPDTVLDREKQLKAPVMGAYASDGPIQRQDSTSTRGEATITRPPNRTGLPDRLKAGVEHLSGVAMDDVRVHYNSAKPAQVQALTYTQGTEIHVGPRQEKHLPHESWHVVQQKLGRVKLRRKHKYGWINDDRVLEREADVMGAKAFQTVIEGAARKPVRSQYSKLMYRNDNGSKPIQMMQGNDEKQEAINSPQNETFDDLNKIFDDLKHKLNEYWTSDGLIKKIEETLYNLSGFFEKDIRRLYSNVDNTINDLILLTEYIFNLKSRLPEDLEVLRTIREWCIIFNNEDLLLSYKKMFAEEGEIKRDENMYNIESIKDQLIKGNEQDFGDSANKAERFLWLWQMKKLEFGGNSSSTGVLDVYQSEFDARDGSFGVAWKISGPEVMGKWVLHGHCNYLEEKKIEIKRLHIKKKDEEKALGQSVEIDNEEFNSALIESSKNHIAKLKEGRRTKWVFEKNAEKIRQNRPFYAQNSAIPGSP